MNVPQAGAGGSRTRRNDDPDEGQHQIFEVAYGRYSADEAAALGERGTKGYAYRAAVPVAVGAVVAVPGTWVNPGGSIATVIRLGSSYRGTPVMIERVVEAAP